MEEFIDLRVLKFFFDFDDLKLIFDLRKNNGKIEDNKFEYFWVEVKKYLEEKSVVMIVDMVKYYICFLLYFFEILSSKF